MQWRNTGNLACHSVMKARHWLRAYTMHFKEYDSRIHGLAEFSKINGKRERQGTLIKDSGNKKHRSKARERQTETRACHCGWTRPPTPGRPDTTQFPVNCTLKQFWKSINIKLLAKPKTRVLVLCPFWLTAYMYSVFLHSVFFTVAAIIRWSKTMTWATSVTFDLRTFPICTDLCNNPKSLPCLHAFCLKCLEG